MGFSSITTIEEFILKFPNFKFAKESFLLNIWNNNDRYSCIYNWLKNVCVRWKRTCLVLPKKSNERLYPLIFDLLSELLCTVHYEGFISRIRIEEPQEYLTADTLLECTEQAIYSYNSNKSLKVSVEDSPHSHTASRTFIQRPIWDIVKDLDSTNKEEIFELYCEIEKFIKTKTLTSGHTEFVISRNTSGAEGEIEIICEVTPALQSDHQQGYYQLCSKMASKAKFGKTLFGVYTDSQAFQFIKLDNVSEDCTSGVFYTSKIYLLKYSDDTDFMLASQAPKIISYFMEMLNAPHDLDLMAAKDLNDEQLSEWSDIMNDVRETMDSKYYSK